MIVIMIMTKTILWIMVASKLATTGSLGTGIVQLLILQLLLLQLLLLQILKAII